MTVTPRPITEREFRLGENPLWDDRRRALFWTDIEAGELWRWTPRDASGTLERVYEGPRVGGFTLQHDGALLLFRETDVAILADPGAGDARSIIPFDDPRCERFNDVICAPGGDVFAGAVGRADDSGGLFHLSRDGRFTELFRNSRFPNGMAFTPDRRWMFYTCSTSHTISRFAFDAATSALSDRQVIHRAAPGQGIPDGLAGDLGGDLWSARYAGSSVLRLRFDGGIVGAIDVPRADVTSVAFGGADQRTLFITTAGGPVYACEPGVAGAPEFRSAIEIG